MKTELLVQMDGIARSEAQVFVLAATNLPWQLDHAMLRRLEKRIFVDLPDAAARLQILRHCLHGRAAADVDLDSLAKRLTGFSASDVVSVAKEAAMRPLRHLLQQLDMCGKQGQAPGAARGPGAAPCAAGLQHVAQADLDAAAEAVRPTGQANSELYSQFSTTLGSGSSA